MSGLEIGALIAGAIGAAASGVSAYKDAKEERSEAVYETTEITQEYDPKIVATRGSGHAGIKANGDIYATSTTGGSATAVYNVDREAWKPSSGQKRR